MKIKQYHWHHFFGGIALLLLIIQLLSGSVLTMFYSPHLKEAYASVQYLYNELTALTWVRDTHRWAAFFLTLAVIMHFIRSFLRKDYQVRETKTLWLTGMLLLLPLLGFLITGFILPWEWRGYWFMEMVPNYANETFLIGPALSQFLLDAFTLNRALMLHVIILPAITLVLIDIHSLSKIKRRAGGLFLYLREHSILALPFLVIIIVLAFALPMPTQDPASIPMPLEGERIPMAEWFVLIFWVPYLYFKGFMAPLLGIYIPFGIFLILTLFPYFLKTQGDMAGDKTWREPHFPRKRKMLIRILSPLRKIMSEKGLMKTVGATSVFLVAMALFVPMYTVTYASPTMGCNSCHNVSAGNRMGIPPATFKDREINPNLKDNTFMVEHWFYPQVVW